MKLFSLILGQSVVHAFRKGGGAFGTCGFYIIIVALFTFALGPEAVTIYAAAVLCVALLLATITAMPLLFERDFEDGTLEQLLLQPVLLEMVVLAKIVGHWLAVMLPILAVSPLLAIISNLSADHTLYAMSHLLLASPTLIAINAVAAALTLGSRRGGLLQALITLPLTIPVLIFAAASGGGSAWFLSAMLFASLPLSCWISAALIRVSQD